MGPKCLQNVRLLLRVLLFAIVVCLLGTGVRVAIAQTITYQGEVGTTAASTTGQPFWLRANEYGRIDPESANGYVRVKATGQTDTSRTWEARSGVELLGRWSTSETLHFSELFAGLRYRFIELRAGRQQNTIGPVRGGTLSAGSLIQSRNATPLPVISLGTAGYVSVPFTNGFAQVKGHYAHGWFSDDRFVENVYLHRKTAYLRLGAGRVVSATMGLVHNAQWGGTSPRVGKLPQDIGAYWDAVFAVSAGETAPEGEQTNVLGNHVGIFDLGSTVRLEKTKISAYHQHLFEDGSSYEWKNFPDGLYGLRWSSSQWSLVRAIQYELLYTKNQSGPVHPPGEDNYYNNFIYRSGWSSNGALIGSPLFLFEPSSKAESETVFSNRLVSHHLGVKGAVSSRLQYRVLGTWRRHFGTFGNPFPEPRTQMSFLLELTAAPFPIPALTVNGAVAVDTGEEFRDRVGLRLGITYSGER